MPAGIAFPLLPDLRIHSFSSGSVLIRRARARATALSGLRLQQVADATAEIRSLHPKPINAGLVRLTTIRGRGFKVIRVPLDERLMAQPARPVEVGQDQVRVGSRHRARRTRARGLASPIFRRPLSLRPTS